MTATAPRQDTGSWSGSAAPGGGAFWEFFAVGPL